MKNETRMTDLGEKTTDYAMFGRGERESVVS